MPRGREALPGRSAPVRTQGPEAVLRGQLLAEVLGTRVFPLAQSEIGWFPIQWTPQAQDEVGTSGQSKVFHWHGEAFELPHGAEKLAHSPPARFRVSSTESRPWLSSSTWK